MHLFLLCLRCVPINVNNLRESNVDIGVDDEDRDIIINI